MMLAIPRDLAAFGSRCIGYFYIESWFQYLSPQSRKELSIGVGRYLMARSRRTALAGRVAEPSPTSLECCNYNFIQNTFGFSSERAHEQPQPHSLGHIRHRNADYVSYSIDPDLQNYKNILNCPFFGPPERRHRKQCPPNPYRSPPSRRLRQLSLWTMPSPASWCMSTRCWCYPATISGSTPSWVIP
jgi:hypothetical protein